MDKSAIRERLVLSDLPTVLIVGGGDGMGGIISQAKAVGERLQKLASSSSSSSLSSSSSSSLCTRWWWCAGITNRRMHCFPPLKRNGGATSMFVFNDS
jgi:hypothetical protein